VEPRALSDPMMVGAAPNDMDLRWTHEYGGSGDSDSDDPERPDPDLVLDDLASRRFHSPSPAPPTNFAMPIMPTSPSAAAGRETRTKVAGGSPCDLQVQEVTCLRSEHTEDRAAGVWMCADDEDDADEDDENDANESKSELLTP